MTWQSGTFGPRASAPEMNNKPLKRT